MNKKYCIIIVFFLNSLLAFSSGTVDPVYHKAGEMQLKIINQTNQEVKIYLNNMDTSLSVKGNENYDSEILLMDLNNPYPFFFCIEYLNNIQKFYIFERTGRIDKNGNVQDIIWDYLFYIIIDADYIYVFDENMYLNQDIAKERWSRGWGLENWRNFDPSDNYQNRYPNCLEILIINDTRISRNIIFKDNIRELYFELDVGEARLIKIHNPIFLQGNRYENKDYKYFSIEMEDLNYPAQNGIHQSVIRVEDKTQIFRLRETTDSKIIIRWQ